jgi:hypothetical protein
MDLSQPKLHQLKHSKIILHPYVGTFILPISHRIWWDIILQLAAKKADGGESSDQTQDGYTDDQQVSQIIAARLGIDHPDLV